MGLLSVVFTGAMLFVGSPEATQDQNTINALASCKDAALESQVQACTVAIDSGSLKDGDLAYAYFLRGYANEHSGKLSAALADYSSAIALKPDYHEALTNRGAIYGEARQFDVRIR